MNSLKTHLFQAINYCIITIHQDLHAHPKLSSHEECTKHFIKGIMEVEGLEVREFQYSYGLITELINRPAEPFVALREDIDALPIEEHTDLPYASKEKGVMYACGHDSHTAIALSQIHTETPGNIMFIFQPAEEITEGENTANVICDHVRLRGTVRTVNHNIRQQIPKMMKISIKGICRSMHTTQHFKYGLGSPEATNDDAMVDLLVSQEKEILGETNCIHLMDPVTGGEDFGRYLELISRAFIHLGTYDPEKKTCVSQHSSRFNVDDDAFIYGRKVMTATALKAIKDA